MVKNDRALLTLLFCFLSIWSWLEADPTVEASIDAMNAHAHYPLQGIVSVTHKKEEAIDPGTFILEGKPLEVSLEREVLMSASSDTLVSIYHFQLPGKDQGLYVLPEIKVKVAGKTYQTIPASYEVQEGSPPQAETATPLPAATTSPIIFHLEATVLGPSTLYPGERTKFYYRITYNRSIDLSKSELPMIHPAHFQKVGDVLIKDSQEKDVTVQELTQEVEASDIGTFQFGPALIEGYAYTMNGLQKVYGKSLLRSEAPLITVEVKPFPKKAQPPSFSGAIGTIQAEASLKSASTVAVGDTVKLDLRVTGIANLAALNLPLLQCQPGFSGFFQTSDLPPLAEVKDKDKFFHIELRPATSLIDQIPPIELSSFNPADGHYVIQKTKAIPLTVIAHAGERATPLSAPLLTMLPPDEKWPPPTLSPLEFIAEPPQLEVAKLHGTGMRAILWLIPIGIGLLMLQRWLHRRMLQRPRPIALESENLFKQALHHDLSTQNQGLSLLELAFWHRLWEKGIAKPGDFHLSKLPPNEEFKSVKAFILELQSLQYGLDKKKDSSELKQTAKQLFSKI